MRLLADENFHNDILRGILRVNAELDIVRVQDTSLYQASDEQVLAWAAQENRVLLTHDVQTVTKHAYERISAGLPMAGVIEVANDIAIGRAIEEISIVLGASEPDELVNRVVFIPLT